MANKVQSKPDKEEHYICNFFLIKVWVIEDVKKLNMDWNTFLFLVGYDPEIIGTPSVKKNTPSSMEKTTPTVSSEEHDGEKGESKEKRKRNMPMRYSPKVIIDIEESSESQKG